MNLNRTQTLVTFGLKYAWETHPTFPGAHPDAVLAVEAESYEGARELIYKRLGTKYAFDYPVREGGEFPMEHFSRGITHILSADGIRPAP